MKDWQPVDWVIIALVGIVCYLLVMMSIAAFFPGGVDVDPEKMKMKSTVFASIIAVISMYVGANIRGGDDK